MRDFQEVPGEDENYSLYLIRQPQALTADTLNLLSDHFLKSNQVISFERLFKGHQSALAVFAPTRITQVLKNLDLLELEDYSLTSHLHFSAWEMELKHKGPPSKIFANFPILSPTEQLWWQVVLSTSFKPQIRAVLVSSDHHKKESISKLIEKSSEHHLTRVPKGFSNHQLLKFYQQRSYQNRKGNLSLSMDEALHLVKL